MSKSIFADFTNQYSLFKTLRFELKPVGETLVNMRKHLQYDKELQTFFKDQEIEDAYQVLKPVFDLLHERFINQSLEMQETEKIDFSLYLEKYRKKKELKDKDFANVEKSLRDSIAQLYVMNGKNWKKEAGNNEKGKPFFTKKSFKILTESGILGYIKKNIDSFSDVVSKEDLMKALSSFEGFFTYFDGFNKNRENYYETAKEASTAVATRIVHENLPKFCDNIINFELRREEYLGAFDFLKNLGKSLVNKDGVALVPICAGIFDISFFNKCLSQRQIEKYNEQIGNANFIINLYNQEKSKSEKSYKKLSLLKTLYKQIGCGKTKALFFAITHERQEDAKKVRENGKEAFSVEEVLLLANKAGEKYFKHMSANGEIVTVSAFLEYLKGLENYDGVYWSKAAINTISNKYFANYHDLKDRLKQAKVFHKSKKGSDDDVEIPEAVELSRLFDVLDKTLDWKDALFKKSILADKEKMECIKKSASASQALIGMITDDIAKHANSFIDGSHAVLSLSKYTEKEGKELIKTWMDHALAVTQMLKYFLVKESKVKGKIIDATVSRALDALLRAEDADWFKWYDALRNFLTKKPQDDAKNNKLKLNFENSTLAGGWDVNKEPANYCVILENVEGKKFLAIIAKQVHNKKFNKVFENKVGNPLFQKATGQVWKKMEYKQIPGPNKMLPKCLLPKSARRKYGADENILAIYDRGSFKKTEANFASEDLHKLINFYKSALREYADWRCFNFSFRDTKEYQDISQFYTDVEKQAYKLDFVDINGEVLNKLVKEGKIYLFEIKNQDSNAGKTEGHMNNLHTLYWQSVFSGIENRPKLNGQAEIFYRKAISPAKLGFVEGKKGKNGNKVIKNFRFSHEKFLFHVPITLNFCLKEKKINDLINRQFSHNISPYYLGIDRGEKHLAYYSVVDQDGKIVDQGTLNLPFCDKNGNQRVVKAGKRIVGVDGKEKIEIVECKDYNDLLEARASDRNFARQNWQTIGTIKGLKEGYISQVVHAIAKMAISKPTYIVLEDLNTGFMRGRQKIEKSVYQKLELAVAKKLNFLVDKSTAAGALGSVTKAFQLTPPVNNYGDIEGRKQVGIMLYTRANYTSQTDPVTGWRKSIYLKSGSEENIKKQIVDAFSDIYFDGKDYCFEYKVGAFLDSNTGEIKPRTWVLYSGKNGEALARFRGMRGQDKNEWLVQPLNVVEMLDGIFSNFDKKRSLLSQIVVDGMDLTKINDHTAWDSLRFAIDIIQQIRNTGITERDNDYILSPVRDKNGVHFDSRVYWDKEKEGEKVELPSCGDANGAFNIARKGIIMGEHIKNGWSLYVSDEEWDVWLSGRKNWNAWIKKNMDKVQKKEK